MIRMTGLVDLKPLREMETRIPQTTEDVTGGVENMEQDQPPKESEGPVDDHEGSMAKADLLSIHKKSGELYNMIAEDEELEGWVQAKITKAAEYITAVHNNMEYEKTKPTTIGNGEMAPADPMNERTIARLQALAGIAPLYENVTPSAVTETVEEATLSEKAPTGWEATVKKMKRKRKIDNPWALAHWMASRGYHPKGKKSKE